MFIINNRFYLEASSCHKKSSKNGIITDVALRLRRICSTMEDFKAKSSESMAYLVARRHSAKSEFHEVSSIPRHETRKKKDLLKIS